MSNKQWLKVFFLTGLIINIFLNTQVIANKNESIPIVTAKNVYHEAELQIIDGVYFLKLKGSYFDMGKQYGVLLQAELNQYIKEKVTPNRNALLKQFPISTFASIEKRVPEQADFLRGISEGSHISYQDLFLSSNLQMLMNTDECSAILIKFNGYLIHAKNSDYMGSRLSSDFLNVIEFNPKGKLRYFYITGKATGLSLQGINEQGISITLNGSPLLIREPRDLASIDIIREVLQSATSLEEAEKIINKYTTNFSSILTVGSSLQKNGCIYDIAYDKVEKNPLNEKNQLFVTNDFLDDKLTTPEDRNSCSRYQMFCSYFKNKQVNSIDELIDLLAQKGSAYGINNVNTIISVVFSYHTKEIYFASAPSFAASSRWYKYSLENGKVTIYKN